jgi:hypothetical protein
MLDVWFEKEKTTEKYYCIYFLYLWGSNVECGEQQQRENEERMLK